MNFVTRTIEHSAPATPQVTYDTGFYYYYPVISIPHIDLKGPLSWLGSALFWLIIIFLIAQIAIMGIFFILAIFRPNKYNCPKCKKTFSYKQKRPRYCPLCGINIDEYIKPH